MKTTNYYTASIAYFLPSGFIYLLLFSIMLLFSLSISTNLIFSLFNKNNAKTNFSMLLLAMSSMVIMACIDSYANIETKMLISISIVVAIILISVYLLGLIFSLFKGKAINFKNVSKKYLFVFLIIFGISFIFSLYEGFILPKILLNFI